MLKDIKKGLDRIVLFKSALNGFSQIFLIENSLSGLLIILGLLISNWKIAVIAVIADICGITTAKALKYNESQIQSGIYGFSAILVAVALSSFFNITLLLFMIILIGASLASILQHFFLKKAIPAFTFPFIIVTWVLYYLINIYYSFVVKPPTFIDNSVAFDFFRSTILAYGEVIFQNTLIASILFILAILIDKPKAFLYTFISSILLTSIVLILSYPHYLINEGIYGFNAILTVMAIYNNNNKNLIWTAIGIIITLLTQIILLQYNVFTAFGGVLTFPFVLATYLILFLQKRIR